jgi:CO/xanthine dehydrogenase Mo-binding subunit
MNFRKIGWSRRPGMGPKLDSPIKRGVGMGTAVWGNGAGPPASSRVTISPDGSVESAMAVQDLGVGTRTLVAMVTAEELGVPLVFQLSFELAAPAHQAPSVVPGTDRENSRWAS